MKTSPPSVDEILKLALSKEQAARDFYSKMASNCTVDFVRRLLQKLLNEEEKHIVLIRSIQSRLNSGRLSDQ